MKFQKGHKQSEEIKQKISKIRIKNKERDGYLNSPNTRKKISEKLKGRKIPSDIRQNMNKEKKGVPRSDEVKTKISNTLKGHLVLEETKNKQRQIRLEKPNRYWLGVKRPNMIGNKFAFINGKSYEPYSVDWTETLKTSIRQRDKFVCQLCFKLGYIVHHIDYNKKNCNPTNLVTLCKSCHSKTNNNRENWIKYFKGEMK